MNFKVFSLSIIMLTSFSTHSIPFFSSDQTLHTFEIKPEITGEYQLNEARIAELKKNFASNFIMRDRLSKITYAATAASLAWLAYQWGIFDVFLSSKKSTTVAELPEIVSPEHTFEYLIKLIAYLKSHEASLKQRIEALEAKNDIAQGNIIVRGIKYVGWTGISIIGSIVVHYKWQRFFDYVLATPSFSWFFSHHSILQTIDGLKRNIKVISEHALPAEYSIAYHSQATIPAIESLVRNLEELVAFTEFYLETIDQEIVYNQKMDSVARYLFNASNDFFKNINPVLQNPLANPNGAALADEFKAEVSTWINRCTLFEREFIND